MLTSLRPCIEDELRRSIEKMGEKNRLRDACEYAVTNGGKRLRPTLVLMIAEALGHGLNVFPAALSVEFFHTASLIADDLPCMDDDDMRRSRPSLHKAFDESIAILASYTLIAAGYGGIAENGKKMKEVSSFADKADEISRICLEAATRCAGIQGATNGQFLDLYPPDSSLETIQKIIFQKTITLFEISFVFGWLFGGGDLASLDRVKESAYHLGMAFQIADDLQDSDQDASQESAINIALACGSDKALNLLERELAAFQSCLEELGIWSKLFQEVAAAIHAAAYPAKI